MSRTSTAADRAGSPADALRRLAEGLREEPVIGPHVRECAEAPALGVLVAAGPRAGEDPAEYALLVEAIREGYLLHYEEPRLIGDADPDLELLAGDYLYALGLERLAARGDLEAVRELADLISLSAQANSDPEGGRGSPSRETGALWLASAIAVGFGSNRSHERAKARLRAGAPGAADDLAAAALEGASAPGSRDSLARAAESVGFGSLILPELG